MDARKRNLIRDRRLEAEADLERYLKAKSDWTNSPSLRTFKDLLEVEQDVLLLRHLALLFGKRTFDPHTVPEEVCGFVFRKGLADGSAELQDAHLYLLTDPWSNLVSAGFVAEAPPGSGMFAITTKGWAIVESNDDAYLPF